MTCKCGHAAHIYECQAKVLGFTTCGCKLLPPPTDDELLLAFVEMCPHQAISDYRRRCCLDWLLPPEILYDHLEQEWTNRMRAK